MIAVNIECYCNYYSVAFSNNYIYEVWNNEVTKGSLNEARSLLFNNATIGYNSKAYDLPMLASILRGQSNEDVFSLNNRLVEQNERIYPDWSVFGIYEIDHIDVMESFKKSDGGVSLAIISCKAKDKVILNLNLKIKQSIDTLEQCKLIRQYNVQNCLHTVSAYNVCKDVIDLKIYLSSIHNKDFRSMQFEAIAEWIIRDKCGHPKITYNGEDIPVSYTKPSHIKYNIDIPSYLYTTTNKSKGLKLPTQTIAGKKYKIGIGGIHSQEKCNYIPYDPDYELVDIDATSYYIYIILNNKLTFMRAGDIVLDTVREWLDIRVEAKRNKDKRRDSAYKLLILSMFGKTGNAYSIFFDPNTFGFITITGQLQLLDLISDLESAGISVESANTDGILTRCHKDLAPIRDDIVKRFEQSSGHTMEYTRFKSIARESVSQYVAILEDGSVKGKGDYADGSYEALKYKGDSKRIVADAVSEYLANETPIEDTINNCEDINKFLIFRRANGSAYAVDTGERLGKVVRFYFSTTRKTDLRNHDGNGLVAGTSGCCPAMNIISLSCDDVDRQWYINAANEKLERLGVIPSTKPSKLKKDKLTLDIFDML